MSPSMRRNCRDGQPSESLARSCEMSKPFHLSLCRRREGVTVEQLRARLKEEEIARRKEKLNTPLPFQTNPTASSTPSGQTTPSTASPAQAPTPPARKDSSPVKVVVDHACR